MRNSSRNTKAFASSKLPVQPILVSASTIANTASDGFPASPARGDVTWKTLLSAPQTASDTFTVGIATCAPSGGYLKCHRHSQAELYHVTDGVGVVTIDGREYPVGKGSVVFIPGNAEHGIRNTGMEELGWLYVFAVDGFGEVVYRFSGEDGVRENAKL